MRVSLFLIAAALLATGCSHPAENNGLGYGQLENDRVYGVVVSQRQIQSTNVKGIISSAGAINSDATKAATGGSFTSWIPFMNDNNQTGVDTSDTLTVEYVVDLDNGKRVTLDQVPQAYEPLAYPGQRVVVQSNNGYVWVLPVDVEGKRSSRY